MRKMNLQLFETPQKGIVGRYQHPGYLDVSNDQSETYEPLGFGVTQLDDSPSAQTKSKRYVTQRSATQSIGSYEWTAPLEFDLIRSEKAIEFVSNIGERELTGKDAETSYVLVYLEKPVKEAQNTFEAKRRRVAVEIAEFSDNDGEIQGSGNLLGVTEWEFGNFNTETKKFTPSGAAASVKMTVKKE